MDREPQERFSDRVDDYIKYRPGYPPAIYELLDEELGLHKSAEIADMGAGTGIFSRFLCDHGYAFVYGVEPNHAMYTALSRQMRDYPNFSAMLSSAEKTDIEPQSIDLVTCAQSFHWFNPRMAKSEFVRILKPQGWIMLAWNSWKHDTPLGKGYEAVLEEFGLDYEKTRHTNLEHSDFDYLWGKDNWKHRQLENAQILDLQGLQGRIASASYTPGKYHPRYDAMMEAITAIFEDHQQDGRVRLQYHTDVYYGQP